MDIDDANVWKIRETIPTSLDHFYEQIMNLVMGSMGLAADRLCAPRNKRIGVFGPYPNGGKEVILAIGKKVSECGFGAITGLGFFPQNQPEELHSLNELMTPVTLKAIKEFDIPDYIWWRHFPKLVCKAVHHLSVIRGQRNEAEGCYSAGIPIFGFILDRRVRWKRKYCNYLVDFGFYSDCMCPSPKFCFYPVSKAHGVSCPFYDYVNIPWSVKQLFINEKNRLVAIDNLQKVLDAVEECIKAKPFKHKVERSA